MAHLDELLARVVDSDLKTQLEAEVSALKNHTRFGLLYERHLPETVIVADTDGLRTGDHVRLREHASNGEDYRVVSVDGGRATILSLNSGGDSEVGLSELLLVKPFGDPAYLGLTPIGSISRSAERPITLS
jgi:adenine-specific DNA-methyltransferase